MQHTAILFLAAMMTSAGASCLEGACQDINTADAASASAMLQVMKSDSVLAAEAAAEDSIAQSPDATAKDDAAAKDWWNTNASETFQHLDRGYVKATMDSWAAFLPKFNWNGRRVLDYGIGAGYLGELLLKNYSIGSYVGVDISNKSIEGAEKVLKPWATKVELLLTPQSFVALAPQIFVSQQVIQHFPSIPYLEEFLSNVDTSGASELMLHFRKSPDGKTIANEAYAEEDSNGGRDHTNKALAVVTTHEFIAEHLPHYELLWSSTRKMSFGTEGEYTGWKLKPAAA